MVEHEEIRGHLGQGVSADDATTIVAIATAAGEGGVGIVRLSGPQAHTIAADIVGTALQPRHAHFVRFRDGAGEVLDDGLALYFPAPASFTGEQVVELQAHGSPVVLRELVACCIARGAQQAAPGEFSQRAFLNGKFDLAQAEAIADLIAAGDRHAARAARRSLEGVFSQRVDALMATILAIRVHVEAAIDFADEPLSTLGGAALRAKLKTTLADVAELRRAAERGRKLRDGLHVVLVGPPNAGKSSLLNRLVGVERAIVTPTPGTTRDVLQETLRCDGVELTLVDTAGLRVADDAIEAEGIRRARVELERADLVLAVVDARAPEAGRAAVLADLPETVAVVWLFNKIDLLAQPPPLPENALTVSAQTGAGLDALHHTLATLAGSSASAGGTFSARTRHVDALDQAEGMLDQALAELDHERLELAAEALVRAHEALGTIGGRVDADGLLGHIFTTFCVGK